MRVVVTALAAAALAAAIPAQAPAARAVAASETDLHMAWLTELLDLDPASAARTYRTVVTDNKALPGKRLVALARLRELQRIGAVEPESIHTDFEVPQPLRDAVDPPAARQPFDRLVEQARKDAPGLVVWLGEQADRATQFNPRPLVQLIYNDALESVGAFTPRERRRQLRLQLDDAKSRNDQLKQIEIRQKLWQIEEPEVRVLQRNRALQLLKLELVGNKAKVDYLRPTWFFREQRPSPQQGSPEAVWEVVKVNLEQFRQSQDLHPGEAELLLKLKETLQQLATDKGPAAALQELDRLPFYRNQLRGR